MRQVARIALLLGAIAIGLVLFRATPRDVTLVYDVARAPGTTALDVEIRRGGDLVRRAELRVAPGETQVRHAVRLREGAYQVAVQLVRPGPVIRTTRAVDVRESGSIVVSVGP